MNFRAVGLAASVLQLVLMSAYVVLETVYGDGFLSGLTGFATILVFAAVGLAILCDARAIERRGASRGRA
jgi:hypothetical protein